MMLASREAQTLQPLHNESKFAKREVISPDSTPPSLERKRVIVEGTMMLSQGVAGAGKLSHRDQFCNSVSLTARTSRPTRKVTVANRHGHSIHAVAEAPVLPFSKDAEHLEQWSKTSWRKRTAHQQPEYVDKDQLQEAVAEIQRMPPLVFAGECRTLQARLAKCAAGESFMLTGGDCAGMCTLGNSTCCCLYMRQQHA